jgi:hypothetical protein
VEQTKIAIMMNIKWRLIAANKMSSSRRAGVFREKRDFNVKNSADARTAENLGQSLDLFILSLSPSAFLTSVSRRKRASGEIVETTTTMMIVNANLLRELALLSPFTRAPIITAAAAAATSSHKESQRARVAIIMFKLCFSLSLFC